MLMLIIVLLAILIFLSILGNLLVICSAIFNKKLRKYTHFLILNLALSDLLISSFSLTLRLLRLTASRGWFQATSISSCIFCRYTICLTITLFAATNFNLLLLTIDRFFAINHALYYKLFFKRRHMFFLIATSWTLALSVGLLPVIVPRIRKSDSGTGNSDVVCTYGSVVKQSYAVFVIMFTFFAPLIVMTGLYISIVKKVCETHTSYQISDRRHPRIRTSLTPAVIKRRERRISLGILCLLGAHTVLLAPISILDLVQIFGGIKIPSIAIEICLLLTYTNPVVNAPIYAAASKEYYKTFTRLLCCFCHLKKVSKCWAKIEVMHGRNRQHTNQGIKIKRENNVWYITTPVNVSPDD